MKLTTPCETVHTLGVPEVKVTTLPDAPPVAVTLYLGPPTVALDGVVEVKVMVWEPLPTVIDWVTRAAAV
jgi:hypothetical protein